MPEARFPWLEYLDSEQDESFPLLAKKAACDRDLARAVREVEGRPLAVLFADLDHFRAINERLGHAGADEVLRGVMQVLRATIGNRGKAYRWGGEELVALLPNFTEGEAGALAERLREEIEHAAFPGCGAGEVSASVGVAQRLTDEPATELLDRADQAVYAAKGMGRNRVYLASGRPWRVGPPSPRARTAKLVYLLGPKVERLDEMNLEFVGYQARSFTSGIDMLNEHEAPDAIIARLPTATMQLASFVSAARAKWSHAPVLVTLFPVHGVTSDGLASKAPDPELFTACHAAGVAYVYVVSLGEDRTAEKLTELIGPGQLKRLR